jgi:hypothetical protein
VSTYTLINTPPSLEAYMHLREAAGLSPKSLQAATLGLAGTWYGVHIRDGTDTIAMGRIIGVGAPRAGAQGLAAAHGAGVPPAV